MTDQALARESELGMPQVARVPIPPRESELPDRLRSAIGEEAVAAFGRRCGIGEATLRKYFKGTLPNIDNLVAIADAANVSIEWLATGRGSKQRGASSIPAIPPAAPLAPSEISLEDIERLATAMEAVEEGLGERYHQLTPHKRAQIVATAYDLLLDEDQKDNVVKFVKLAA